MMVDSTTLAPKIVGGILIVFVVLSIVLISISLEKLDSDEIGLKYDTISKKLANKSSTEGLHNGPPGFTFIIFPAVFRSLDFEDIQCLNNDGVEINLDIGFQYRVKPEKLTWLVSQFRTHKDFSMVMESIAESAIHDACSQFKTSQFQAERGAFQESVRSRLVSKLDLVDTEITDLQVSDIRRPSPYESAVKGKESAREDIEVARNEKPKKLTEAATEKLESETQAQIAIDKAESNARIREARAQAEASAILDQYTKEAEAYKSLISSSGLGLDLNGLLSYMSMRTLEEAKNEVQINVDPPAKTNWLA